MDVSLSKLQQIIAVARCGSFSRAAEELNITQPALSRSIASIERRCGFPIFNRIGHGVEPTAAGAHLLLQAEPLMQSMRVFGSNIGLLASGQVGTLRIGFPPLLASQLLADLAKDFFTPPSEVELRISIRSGPALLEELKNDSIEMFIFAATQIETGPEVELETIGTIAPTCVVRRGHPLAEFQGVTTAHLAKYPWASSVEPPAMGEQLNSARLLCDNYNVLRDAVLQTDLVCICTRTFVANDLAEGRMLALKVPNFLPETIAVFAARLRGRTPSPLAKAAVKRIAALLAISPTDT